MIKQEIRSLIKNLLPKYDSTAKYHDKVIDASIEKVLSEMYNELWTMGAHLLSAYTKTYGLSTAITVSTEAGSTLKYSTLPAKIVPLPDKSSGVRAIYTVAQTGNVFHPMSGYEADLIFNSDSAVVTNKIGYRVRQDDRVDYYNMNAVVEAAGVRMDLLVPFSVYAETDTVLIPEFKNKQGESFADRVVKILANIPPVSFIDQNKEAYKQPKKE